MTTRSVFVSVALFLVIITTGFLAPAAVAQDANSPQATTIMRLRTIDSDEGRPAIEDEADRTHEAEDEPAEMPEELMATGQTPIPAALQAPPASTTPPRPLQSDGGSSLKIVPQQSPPAIPPDAVDELQPIPDPEPSGEVNIETASFKGITPGKSTAAELQEAWGSPKQMAVQADVPVHLYAIDPFDRIEVTLDGNVVASIIIRLQRAVPAKPLAEQLKMGEIHPVLVSNELGEILGQSYPERGVLFAFEPAGEPGKATMRVVDVILEPVNAEAFVLRAETYFETRLAESAKDLEHAIELQPDFARAHWLQARLAAAMGSLETAMSSSAQAIRLDPANAQYLVTRAQILGQFGRYAEAILEAQAAVENAENRPHVKARALCLLGDLTSSQPKADYAKALESHMEAVAVADPLITSPHPAIRIAAMEVLIDAHLGAAQDIAWGQWENKKVAVTTWLDRASEYAEAMIATEAAGDALRFRVATRALAACVGAHGDLTPGLWTERAVTAGVRMIEASEDPLHKRRMSWDLGLALYDAVQVHQLRDEQDFALEVGRRAIDFLENGMGQDLKPADALLLGRLNFRLGTIYAVNRLDHREAVRWFDKSVPLFQKGANGLPPHEVGRLGETLVSMGVSYWEVGNRELALRQTEAGVELIEAAVESGLLNKTALEVPYSNLAAMHRQLGQSDRADRFLKMASEHRGTIR